MKKLFWGFVFMFINFNLTFGENHIVNFLPPFVGYLLLLAGTREMEKESALFLGARPLMVGMTVYTALLWAGDVLGLGSGSWMSSLLELAATAAALYVEWVLVQAIRDTETRRSADLNGAALQNIWKRMLVLQLAAQIFALIANISNVGVLAVVWMVLAVFSFVNIVLFLMAVWKSRGQYEALAVMEQEAEPDPGADMDQL